MEEVSQASSNKSPPSDEDITNAMRTMTCPTCRAPLAEFSKKPTDEVRTFYCQGHPDDAFVVSVVPDAMRALAAGESIAQAKKEK